MEDFELPEIINSFFPSTLQQNNGEDLYSIPRSTRSEANLSEILERKKERFQSLFEFNAEIEEPNSLSSIDALENEEERLKQNELIQIGALKSPPGRDLTQNSNSKGVRWFPVNSRKRKQVTKLFTSFDYDGYKWHKYGQKHVRGNIFPRNYYRCSKQTCEVRKRTERFESDPNTLVITYDGEHNHDKPSIFGKVFDSVNDPNLEKILLNMGDSDRIIDSKTSGGLLEDVVRGFLQSKE